MVLITQISFLLAGDPLCVTWLHVQWPRTKSAESDWAGTRLRVNRSSLSPDVQCDGWPGDGCSYSNHGPWSVSGNIGQRLRHGPRVTGATLPGSHSHTELRVTARWFLPPTAPHYHDPQGESEDGHVTNIGHPVSYCQWLVWTLVIRWSDDTMMSGQAGWLRSHDVLAHEIYNNTRPAPGYAHYIATHLQYTAVHCITSQYRCYCRPGKKGKFWFPSLTPGGAGCIFGWRVTSSNEALMMIKQAPSNCSVGSFICSSSISCYLWCHGFMSRSYRGNKL